MVAGPEGNDPDTAHTGDLQTDRHTGDSQTDRQTGYLLEHAVQMCTLNWHAFHTAWVVHGSTAWPCAVQAGGRRGLNLSLQASI